MTMNGEAVANHNNDVEPPAPRPVHPAGVPLEKKLERTDFLEMENLYLKASNVRFQIEQQQAELAKSGQFLNGIKSEIRAKQIELSEKYGVDFQSVHITPDGVITPQAPVPQA